MSVQFQHIPILAFHKVDPKFEWGLTRATPCRFRKVLEFLKVEGYESIHLSQCTDPHAHLPQRPVVITFDDSYESIYTHALPILEELGFTATIFIITGFAGQLNTWDVNLGNLTFRHLNWNQVKDLDRLGFEIGSHTIHHPDLTRIRYKFLMHELVQSKWEIEQRIGISVDLLSFPFGRYNQTVINVSREVGYKHGCGFWLRKKEDETFVIPRKAYYLFDTTWNLQAKLDHHWGRHFEAFKLRVINFCSHGTSLVKKPIAEDEINVNKSEVDDVWPIDS